MIPNGHYYEKFGLCRECSKKIERKVNRYSPVISNEEIDLLLRALYSEEDRAERTKHDNDTLNIAYTQFSTAVVLDYQNTVKRVYYNKCSRGFKEVPCTNFVMTDPLSGKQYKG